MDRRQFLKVGTAAASFTIAAPAVLRAATMTMRFAHFADENHPANIAAKQFAANIEKRTDGAIKIAIFPNNQLIEQIMNTAVPPDRSGCRARPPPPSPAPASTPSCPC